MDSTLLALLICPDCTGDRALRLADPRQDNGDIVAGTLICTGCGAEFPVIDGIPRFVRRPDDYAGNFAFEWERWGRVQIDRFAGHRLSTRRFLADSRWDRDWLKGRLILDAGCGAGRFTDVAASFGARVIAVDLSGAVAAARRNTTGHCPPVQIVQASLFRLPFRRQSFDGVFCMGVIQHTPDPRRLMEALPALLKEGGRLCYNFYERDWRTKLQPLKYGLRCLTRYLPNGVNYALSLALTALFFPLSLALSRIRFVRIVNIALPICASHDPALTLRQQFIWTLLDTFDWYSPRYETRQDHRRVADLLRGLGLDQVDSAPGLAWAVQAGPEGRAGASPRAAAMLLPAR
jgi:2-polyprenyl-3-methyl-5-hydroxy-6-metoxy-1,4-benzoquinol methylase/uncharacterized protein YbaR (Trm112 family)